MNLLINRFRQSVRDHRLIQPGDSVLCAVSGGPDSMALLKLLLIHRRSWKLRIGVFHMNHSLRKSSAKDLAFVREFCEKEAVPFHSVKANVLAIAQRQRLSIEEAARNARYEALHSIAIQRRYSVMATAHTLDDQSETVLMRLLRGSGLKGLLSIVPKCRWKKKLLIRPLLEISKAEILQALKQQKIRYRIDVTNHSDRFFRNRVRKELLPFIESRYSPAFRSHLVALSVEAEEIYAWVSGLAEIVIRKSAIRKGKSVSLPVSALKKLPPPVLQQVMFQWIESVKGDRRHMSRAHMRALNELLNLSHDAKISLPQSLTARRHKRFLTLTAAGGGTTML